jgi:hypothetical protein
MGTAVGKGRLIAVVALALSACAENSFPALQAKLERLKGQPVTKAIEKIGQSDEQTPQGDGKTYIWNRVDSSRPEFAGNFYHCTIEIFTDKDGKITGYSSRGDGAGCDAYVHMLDSGS